jgi:hypothetical protein
MEILSFKNKWGVLRLARENKPLDEMNPADISIVILDQLPKVIDKHTKNKCLFSRDLLGLSTADISERMVANNLKSDSDRRLWDRLVKHWSFLRKVAYIDANALAQLFAPGLLGLAASTGSEKGIKFLEKIINEIASSNNLINSSSLNESKSLTETSINQELMLASNSKLKESSVYQDFIMSNTQSSNKSKRSVKNEKPRFKADSDEDDDDENDDDDDVNDAIDALIAPKSGMSTNSSKVAINQPAGSSIIKSPRGLYIKI